MTPTRVPVKGNSNEQDVYIADGQDVKTVVKAQIMDNIESAESEVKALKQESKAEAVLK